MRLQHESKFHPFQLIDDVVDIIRYSLAAACHIIKQPVKVFLKVFRKHPAIFPAQLYQAFFSGVRLSVHREQHIKIGFEKRGGSVKAAYNRLVFLLMIFSRS